MKTYLLEVYALRGDDELDVVTMSHIQAAPYDQVGRSGRKGKLLIPFWHRPIQLCDIFSSGPGRRLNELMADVQVELVCGPSSRAGGISVSTSQSLSSC